MASLILAIIPGLEKEIDSRIEAELGKDIVGNKKKTRRQRNQRRVSASSESVGVVVGQPSQMYGQSKTTQPVQKSSLKHDQTLFLILLSMIGLLCLLNLFLVFKIWALESKMAMTSEHFANSVNTGAREPSSSSEWLDILHKQEVLHSRDLAGWKAAVESAAKLLQQTENNMLRLSQVGLWRQIFRILFLSEIYERFQS